MSNEMMKKENQEVSTQVQPPVSEVLKSDIVIPKVLLMQGQSDFVQERKAQQGDIVRSSTAEKLGDDKTSLEFIPLTIQNLWMITEDQKGDGKKYEFRRYEPRNAANENDPWDYIENGTKWKRTKIISVFAILPRDVEAQKAMEDEFKKTGELPDVDKVLLPVVIQFKNTSFKAGRDVATIFAKADSLSRMYGMNIPPFGTTMRLSCFQDKNDKGSFFIYKVESIGKTKKEYVNVAEGWYKTLKAQADTIKVDESDVKETVVEEASSEF